MSRIYTISWILFLAGFLLAGVGFVVNTMWIQIPWKQDGILLSIGMVSLLSAYMLGRFFKCPFATSAAFIWLSALIYFGGIAPFGSVLLVSAAALSLGSFLVPENGAGRISLSLLGGVAILCGADGWLLPYPVHGHAVYLLILLAVVILRWHVIVRMVQPIAQSWTKAVESSPQIALFAITVVGIVSTCAWIPTIHYDDLSYHLGLPYQLQTLGYYRMDVASQIWAIAPWSSDILQGMAQVIAGSESRGAVDTLWLILTAILTWSLCAELGFSAGMRWLAAALFCSLPVTEGTLSGMQTEGPTAAVMVGIGLLIQRTRSPDWRNVLLAGLLFGLLLGLKISNLLFAGPLFLWLLWQWGPKVRWRIVPIAVILAVLVFGSSYVYCYLLTGNPALPIFNQIFHSPYIKLTGNHGPHWVSGHHWRLLWDMTFHSSNYGQSTDGAGGFILLALLGSLLVAIFHRPARPLALAASIAFLLPLTQVQYLRYPHPAMALLVPAMLCGVRVDNWSPGRARAALALVIMLIVGNLVFVLNGDWQSRDGALWSSISRGTVATIDTYAPIRRMAQIIRDRFGDGARTLVIDGATPYAAEFAGKAYVINWYDQELAHLAPKAGKYLDSDGWSGLFEYTGVNLLLVSKVERTSVLDAAIQRYQGQKIYQFDDLELWELHPGLTGVAVPSPPQSVIVKFDTSSAPTAATIVNADVELECKSLDIPIVITWDITQGDGNHWRNSEWATCLQSGRAEVSLDLTLPVNVTAFSMTALPAKAVDLQLHMNKAKAALRRDLTADRDLAVRWRSDPIGLMRMRYKAQRAARANAQ